MTPLQQRHRQTLHLVSPATPPQLHAWLRHALGVVVPRHPLTPGHRSPFDYLCHAFFEPNPADLRTGDAPPRDAVVWAARGAGKTFYAALATALDLIFKPGIQVRTLGGSLEQSKRMHHHLRAIFERDELRRLLDQHTAKPITDRRIQLANGSAAEVLAQSHTSVRGVRPHKLRCDEVDLFDHDVWNAAQLTTRSEQLRGQLVHGAIEALSTFHRTNGVMATLLNHTHHQHHTTPPAVHQHVLRERTVFRWSVIDVLQHCPTPPHCHQCQLRDDCRGAAKRIPPAEPGHLAIDDALRLKQRAPKDHWETEMLCLPPSNTHNRSLAVLPEFDTNLHVTTNPPTLHDPVVLAGMDFGLRAPTVVLFAITERPLTFRLANNTTPNTQNHPDSLFNQTRPPVHVIGEHLAADLLLEQHVHAIKQHPALNALQPHAPTHHNPQTPLWIAVDPAGHQRNDQTGLSPISLLVRHRFRVRTHRLPIDTGIRLLRSRLLAPPSLTIHPRCQHLINAMADYHYPPTPPNTAHTHNPTPAKDGPDHAVDALRYLLTNLDAAPKTTLFDSARTHL